MITPAASSEDRLLFKPYEVKWICTKDVLPELPGRDE